MKFLIVSGISLLLLNLLSFSQAPPPPPSKAPPPAVRSTPEGQSEPTDAELDAKMTRSLSRPVFWKKFSPAGFDLTVELPREPIRKQEMLFDESFGNLRLAMQLSVGDGVLFLMGRAVLPYKVTDEKLLREMYLSLAQGLQEDGSFKFGESRDFRFEENLGVEMIAPLSGTHSPPVRFRGFMLGSVLYILASMPLSAYGDAEPMSKVDGERIQSETDRFFNSVALTKKPAVVAEATAPPMFAAKFDGKIFNSEYFGFTFAPPAGWLNVDQEDVDGIRRVGKDIVAANTGRPTPLPKARQNLVTFVSKPLGNEGVAMIAFNLGLKGATASDAAKVAAAAEDFVSKVPIYQILKRPEPTRVGGLEAYTMETKIKMSESVQNQIIFFVPRRDFIIAVTVTYFDEGDRVQALASIGGLKFAPIGNTAK